MGWTGAAVVAAGALAVLALSSAGCASARFVPVPAAEAVVPGTPAPGFRLNAHDGSAVEVGGGPSDRWTVIAFYPKAGTFGCTGEMCGFRDRLGEFARRGVRVVGVSRDPVAALAEFHRAESLNFPLLSDADGSAGWRYGVVGEGGGMATRVTFLVDPAGVVRLRDDGLNPFSVADRVLAALDRLGVPAGR